MDLYICTTPRHLLFAILRAQSRPQRRATLAFFSRHLEQDKNQWHPEALPDHISLHFLPWQEIKQQMALRPWGLWMRLRNSRQGRAPQVLEKPFCEHLNRFSPGLGEALLRCSDRKLFIFHDRNPIARLFVQLFDHFVLIEDGEGNYIERRLSGVKRLLRRWRKLPENRVFGEGAKCEQILVLKPDALPRAVHHKGRAIDFLDLSQPELILRFFNIRDRLQADKQNIVLLTQPLERLESGSKSLKKKVFAFLARRLGELGYNVILKVHPRESVSEYAHLDCKGGTLDPRVPIEAVILGANAPITLLSIQSTAGSGFEAHCRPLKLVERQMNEAIASWQSDELAWRKALDQTLQNGLPAHR
ncbi:polysialyltransferase family glycosyltransferase [Ferrimonas gelatinilytica]|uniref:Glycosyltransferase family 52 n=1 Tax=Ferrimonas gelatinilytica TaxID=1255257 RepID=A0ABP9S9I8_9GAMM